MRLSGYVESDPMISPHFSYLLAGPFLQARVEIYRGFARGFPFQDRGELAADVDRFLCAETYPR